MKWFYKCFNGACGSGKISDVFRTRRNSTPTQLTGVILKQDDHLGFFHYQSGKLYNNNSFAEMERRDFYNISKITLTYSRHSDLNTTGKYEITLLDNQINWTPVLTFNKDEDLTNENIWETSITIINFNNCGIQLRYSDVGSDKEDMASSTILLT